MFELNGKTALITGATGGIGRAIVKTLYAQGATVALTDMNLDTLKVFQAELGAKDRVFVYEANISDGEAVKKLIADAEKDMGKIDILVNNAGINRDTLAMRMTDEQWDSVLAVNLTAGFRLARAAMVGMMKRRFGRIISMASIVGVIGNAGQANYAASKAGIIALTKSVAKELGSRGIRANAIAPGFIITDMTKALSEDTLKQFVSMIPMRRGGEPEEVAKVALFLASDLSSYVSGQVIQVNGAMA